MGTLIESLARWAISLTPSTIPGPVLGEARLQVMSILAALHAGARSDIGKACHRAALASGSSGKATLLATGEKVSIEEALFANASLSMVHDFDDYVFLGHTGHGAVLASMAVAEHCGASLSDMLCAQVAANEVAGRLGAFVAVGPANGQLWAHVHLAAAVVAAARLFGLDPAKAASAMAIAFGMPSCPLRPAFFGSDAKILTASMPAISGLHAVRLAMAGLDGPLDILEHERGFASHFSFLPLPQMLGGLGEAWVTRSLSTKLNPGCAYVSGPVAAALAATGGRKFEPAEVDEVHVEATALTTTMERLCECNASDPMDPVAVCFSARRCVAIALIEGDLGPEHMDAGWLVGNRYNVQSMASRTFLRESRSMTMDLLAGLGLGVDLSLLLKDVGPANLLKTRGKLRSAFSEALGTPPALRRRSWRDLASWTQPVQTDTIAMLGDMVKRTAGRTSFDMATSRFDSLEFRFAADVSIRLVDGTLLRGSVRIPPGAAGRPFTERRAAVEAKLRACMASNGSPGRADSIIEVLNGDPQTVEAADLARACSG